MKWHNTRFSKPPRWIFSALVFSGLFSFSKAYALMAFEVAPQDIDRIVVVGLEATVQLTHQPTAVKLRVMGIDDTSDPGNFALEKKDRTLFIKMQ